MGVLKKGLLQGSRLFNFFLRIHFEPRTFFFKIKMAIFWVWTNAGLKRNFDFEISKKRNIQLKRNQFKKKKTQVFNLEVNSSVTQIFQTYSTKKLIRKYL